MKIGDVIIGLDGLEKAIESVMKSTRERVYVGIPSSAASRGDGATINNAEIGYMNEYGAPEANIPARPHLVPGVKAVQGKVIGLLTQWDDANALDKAGMLAVNSVRGLIYSGLQPPLSLRTLAGRKGGEGLPLLDTGNYSSHITYVIGGSE